MDNLLYTSSFKSLYTILHILAHYAKKLHSRLRKYSLVNGHSTNLKTLSQEKKYRLQNKIDDLKKKGKEMFEDIEGKKTDLISKWEEKSREFIDTFLMLFGRDGRLTQYLTEKKDSVMSALSPPSSPKAISQSSEDCNRWVDRSGEQD